MSTIYKTYKNSFKSIIIDNDFKDKVIDALIRTNKIMNRAYAVLRLYLIKCFNENNNLFDKTNKENEDLLVNIIKDIFQVICTEIKGRGKRRKLNNEMNEFYINYYLPYQKNKNLLNKDKLTQVLAYEIKKIVTCYGNSITSNYITNLFRFINSVFNYKEDKNYMKLKDKGQIKEFKYNHFKELKKIKYDLLHNTLKSDIKYHKWINEIKNNIIPIEFNKSINYDLKVNPLKYLKYLVFMNKYLEDKNKSLFQVFPLRTNLVLKSITIDTKVIIELTIDKGKEDLYKDKEISKNKNLYWSKYFNSKIIKDNKNYKFNNQISTDGISVSINYIHNSKFGTKYNKNIKDNNNEFLYIDEVNYEQLKNKYNTENFIFCDPGKNNLLYMMDKNGIFMRYTNKQRLKETERLKIQHKILRTKIENRIHNIEYELSLCNKKTLNFNKFIDYIKIKEGMNDELFNFYRNELFRKLKWKAYINKQRTESKLINNLKDKYGEKSNIVIGNWNVTKQMRNFVPTPCIGIKRLLKRNFNVLTIDEYRTSCLSYIDESRVTNLKINGKKIHPVLMLTQKNGSTGCISRDKNAVYNMKKIFECYIKDKSRPINFSRKQNVSDTS